MEGKVEHKHQKRIPKDVWFMLHEIPDDLLEYVLETNDIDACIKFINEQRHIRNKRYKRYMRSLWLKSQQGLSSGARSIIKAIK